MKKCFFYKNLFYTAVLTVVYSLMCAEVYAQVYQESCQLPQSHKIASSDCFQVSPVQVPACGCPAPIPKTTQCHESNACETPLIPTTSSETSSPSYIPLDRTAPKEAAYPGRPAVSEPQMPLGAPRRSEGRTIPRTPISPSSQELLREQRARGMPSIPRVPGAAPGVPGAAPRAMPPRGIPVPPRGIPVPPGGVPGTGIPPGAAPGVPGAAPRAMPPRGIPVPPRGIPVPPGGVPGTGIPPGAAPGVMPSTPGTQIASAPPAPAKSILINFNNVSIIEYIRFISKISNKNFVFDEADLQFNVTIVSEEPTSVNNIISALIQELRIHGLALIEQDDNFIIHRSPTVNAISKVIADNLPEELPLNADLVTQVFRLNTADPSKAAAVIRPLVSAQGLVEVFIETNSVIVTDLLTNITQISQLLKSLDAPNGGMVIGQYVVRTGVLDNVILLAQKIMLPISQNQPLIFVPHRAANSIFVVSTPFLVERTLSIMQYLDQNQGTTRIFNLKDLRFFPEHPGGGWQLDENGTWVFRPLQEAGAATPPEGYWYIDDEGNWRFHPGRAPAGYNPEIGPDGQWVRDAQGNWLFQLYAGQSISPQRLIRPERGLTELPPGHIERTQFYIHKLRYRKGDQLQIALARIGQSLRLSGSSNVDLIEAIDSIQWIESSNSLIFSGTPDALLKIKELIAEIDTPLRQVFIEMLILDTTLADSLRYGVSWETQFGGGDVAGGQSFLPADRFSPLPEAMRTTIPPSIPDATGLLNAPGYNLGIIGRSLTHDGLFFSSIGALIRAIHVRDKNNIVLTPKILTEDNSPAEIFVGINTQFPTQAVVNDRGSIITQNFEYRDIGTRLRVTPQIGNNDVITMTITEEVSNIIPSTGSETGITTSKSTTTTKVHLPNEFFLVMSGMIREENTITRTQIPCLGGLPVIGAAFSDKRYLDTRRNLMIFIRPRIIDTDDEIQNITKHQQDVFKYMNYMKNTWKVDSEEFLDFMNLPRGNGSECTPDGIPFP